MFIRLIIGGLRTFSTFTLAMILVLNLVILVATSVAFNFITKPNLPAAISEDLDVTGRMHSVTSQVMQVVPLKSLEKLEPLVGKKRSLQMIKEAESLRSTLSDRIASETGKTADNIVTNALPAYLFGQVDEDGFRDQLAIDLGAVRGDVEAALTASGSLVVNAICEAIEAQIDTAIAPLSKQVNSQVSLDSVITAVNLLEARLDQLRAVVKEIRQYVSLIEANNPTSISNRLKQLEKLCETVIDTARKRIKDLEKAPADTGWSLAMQQLNADLQVPVRRYSQEQAQGLGRSLATAIVGSGKINPPGELTTLFTTSLLPFRLMIRPVIAAGKSMLSLMSATIFWCVLILVLAANRTKYLLISAGFISYFFSILAGALAQASEGIVRTSAGVAGGVGTVVDEAGFWVGKLIFLLKRLIALLTGNEPDQPVATWAGWNTSDITSSSTYQVFQNDAIAPLVEWMNTSSTLATVLILTGAGVWLAELLCRRGSPPEPGTLRFYLRQKGGIKNINLCMLAIPQGDQRKIQTSLVETQPLIVQQRFRFIIMDTALLLFAYTTTFVMVAWFSAFVTGMTLVLLPGAFIALVSTLTLIVVFRLLKPSAASGWGLFNDEVTSDEQGRVQKVSRLKALRGSLGLFSMILIGTLAAWVTGAFGLTWLTVWLVLLVLEATLLFKSRGERNSYNHLTKTVMTEPARASSP